MNRDTLEAGSPLTDLRGIGPKRSLALSQERLTVVEDLLFHFPVRYEDRRRFVKVEDLIPDGPPVSLAVTVRSSRLIHTRRKGFRIVRARVADDTGDVEVVWFNQPYLKQHLHPGRELVLYGRPVNDRRSGTLIRNPEIEMPDPDDDQGIHTGRIVPVYRRLPGLSPRMLRTLMFDVLNRISEGSVVRELPDEVTSRPGAIDRLKAFREVHFPSENTDPDQLERFRTPAWLFLAFEEMFLLQLGLGLNRARYRVGPATGPAKQTPCRMPDPNGLFRFRFTAAQVRAAEEIAADLAAPVPMARLLQGDVGCGKTAVAVLALLAVTGGGRQAALMAPTSILAAQHFRNLLELLQSVRGAPEPVLLIGDTRPALRKQLLVAIADGSAKLVVGTHALFDPGVRFHDLGLAIVDEQHRFGVLQRAALAEKGGRPDLLVMTATPIPRTVAMTVYGDLDLSVIDELPPGREPVRTVVRSEKDREQVYRGVREAVRRGSQVYIVAPAVEDGGERRKSATGLARQLEAELFKEIPVGLLHGRLSSKEKNEVMESFRSGRLPILVATTVIEVGLDVPNATAMVVEDAGRFGLAQLHQLRGRIGRGEGPATCILMTGDGPESPEAEERLAVIAGTNDGFEVAERDLELRGPGSLLGSEQHGIGDLWFVRQAMARPDLLAEARSLARRFLDRSLDDAETLLASLPAGWRSRLRIGTIG